MGVAPRLDPASLPEGMASEGRNLRFRNGVAETRRGVAKPGWVNYVHPSTGSEEINPWTEVHGAGVYRDPNSLEFVIIAANNKAYFCREGNNPVALSLPDGVSISGQVNFVQAFNKLVMYRGKDHKPLEMSSIDTGFVDQVEAWDSGTTYVAGDKVAYGPFQTITSATHSSGTVTVTLSNHGYVDQQDVTISGANESEYNGRFTVTRVNDSTFTYAITSTPSSDTASGTVKATNHFDYHEASSTSTPAAGEDPINYSSKWAQVGTVMPNADDGVSIANRICVPTNYDTTDFDYDNKKDFVIASDLLSTTATYFDQNFRINQGSDDELVGLLPFDQNRLICFKTKSVHLLTGFIVAQSNTTFGQSVQLETLINGYGMAGPRACVSVGSDIYFYASKRGIVSLRQTEQGKAQSVDIPLSEPVQTIIDEIDPRHGDKVRLAAWDNKLYCAIPKGNADNGECSAILVWDFINQAWAGYDDGTAIRVKEFFTATVQGEQRLFYWGGDGFVSLIEEHDQGDQVRDTNSSDNLGLEAVESVLTTRGYGDPDLDHRWFNTARVNVATWHPSFTVKLRMDGVAEEHTLCSDRTKSRTNYYRPFDADPYDVSNVNDDHGTPYREDYTVTTITEVDNAILQEGGDGIMLEGGDNIQIEELTTQPAQPKSNGIIPMRMQESLEPFALNVRQGRYGQLEITNNQGRMSVKQVTLETATGGRTLSIKA
tara:strand:+ start:687 stop:2828 length:2142 start_codon:yes stop_codon:yes gene_type:complete